MTNLIAIHGTAGSGKDVTGSLIQQLTINKIAQSALQFHHLEWSNYALECNGKWKIKKFAYAVKQILNIITGIPLEDFEKEKIKNSYYHVKSGKLYGPDGVIYFDNLIGTVEDYENEVIKKGNDDVYVLIRVLLQFEGTSVGREQRGKDSWVNILMRPFNEELFWIITDLRYENEAEAIRSRGGITINVIRPDNTKKMYSKHSSETSLKKWKFDYTIINDGSIEDLKEKVRNILKELKIIE